MKVINRVKKYREYKEIFNQRKFKRNEIFTVYYRKNEFGLIRVGLHVSKRNGIAVKRVKIKRQVRAILDKYLEYTKDGLDLIVVIYVKEHKEFKRDGVDIYSAVEITFPQAALGDIIEVNTLDGKQQLTIPAGVVQDKVLQIKGAGVPYLGNSSKRGNHNFVVKIKTPQNLSAEEKQLYKKLYEINCNKKTSSKFIDKMKNVLHN